MISYKKNDSKGWNGNPKFGAAFGRCNDLGDSNGAYKLHINRVRLNQGGYDINGTYFGLGNPLYWIADETGDVDRMLRAENRHDAEKQVKVLYPNASFRKCSRF